MRYFFWRVYFIGIGIFCDFYISAISIDPQNSAKIKQPQKIPVLRYQARV